jgi:hypothetical protein
MVHPHRHREVVVGIAGRTVAALALHLPRRHAGYRAGEANRLSGFDSELHRHFLNVASRPIHSQGNPMRAGRQKQGPWSRSLRP